MSTARRSPKKSTDRPVEFRSTSRRSRVSTPTLSVSEGAALAHELRAPLATLSASLELMDDRDGINAEEMGEIVHRMRRSVLWLEGVIENLTAVAAQDSGQQRRRSAVPVLDWIESAQTIAQPLLDRKHQRLHLMCPRPAPIAYVNSQEMGQVLLNLLTNASNYSPPGAVITVEVSVLADWISIRVTDSGPGVPAEEQAEIFGRYVRGVAAAESGCKGLGLGLHIVKTYVEAHHGRVGLESTPGQGATFWFKLPTVASVLEGGTDRRVIRMTERKALR